MQPPDITEIARTRKRMKLTQTQLADASGVSQSLIARAEAGTVDPRYSKVVAIFAALEKLAGGSVKAEDIMTKGVTSVTARDSMEEAAKLMKKKNISQIPVVEGKNIVGSLTEQAVLDQVSAGIQMKDLSSRPVGDYMRDALPTVAADTPLAALSALLEHNPAVIVSEKGETKGIVTKSDLLKMVKK